MNHALGYLRAYEVNVSVLSVPSGAALWVARPEETPGRDTLVGGRRVLPGIFLAQRRRRLVPDELRLAKP